MSETNTALWERLCKTDEKYTKEFNKRGFQGTSINGQYIIKRLTEEFGPVGVGWGLEIEEDKFVQGHVIRMEGGAPIYWTIHMLRGYLWYMLDGERRRTSSNYGQTDFVGMDKRGIWTDEDAPKKSLTDLRAKCASELGMAADIHLGLWDDNKYGDSSRSGAQTGRGDGKSNRQPKNLGWFMTTSNKLKTEEALTKWYKGIEKLAESDLSKNDLEKLLHHLGKRRDALVEDTLKTPEDYKAAVDQMADVPKLLDWWERRTPKGKAKLGDKFEEINQYVSQAVDGLTGGKDGQK